MNGLLYLARVLPGDLLEDLGVENELLKDAATVLALVGLIAGGVTAILKAIGWLQRRLRLRDPEERRRLHRRQLFASYVEGRVRDLNRREEWSDYRFAELEAEVETVDSSKGNRFLAELRSREGGLRREKSLSRALVKSKERLILLRGDPGSGKSVALRYVAKKLATNAMETKHLDEVIPLYVNLKDLRRGSRPVNVQLIEDFVLASVERGGDREVHRFLEDEFATGKAEGSWFFLFDSFDEIPEVLSSTEDDETVSAYSGAISEFIEGMHSCRGVIASRYFRAPQQQGLPTFRIVPLSEKRKLDLIAKAGMGSAETQLIADLRALPPELATLSANPLFLGLLVEYVKGQERMPEGWHDVFEAFVSRRLETDRERLMKMFDISDEDLRRRSEEIAFTMTATEGFGLSPTKTALKKAYLEAGFGGVDSLDASLSALTWTKLARTDTETPDPSEETFTFAHRRFQEYFATCVVLREKERVDARTLLTDANWRETAVTLCHAQPGDAAGMIAEADALLAEAEARTETRQEVFIWQPGVLHLLSLLQSAFAGRTQYLPDALRRRVATVLREADEKGTRTDRKWALEVAGTAPASDMVELLLKAFRGRSDWLREVAYRQVARLSEIPASLSTEIRRALIEKTARGELTRDWPATKAQLMRLRPALPFVRAAQLLRLVPTVDASVFALGVWGALMTFTPPLKYALAWLVLAMVAHLSYYPIARATANSDFSFFVPSWSPDEPVRHATGTVLFLPFLLACRAAASFIPLVLAIAPELADELGITFGLVPREDLTHGGMLIPALIWAYASTWSIAATLLSVRETPSALSWPFIPLRIIWNFFSWLWRKNFVPLLIGLAAVAVMLVLFAGAGFLVSVFFDLLPDVVGLVIGVCFFVILGGSMLFLVCVLLIERVSDWRNSRRSLDPERTQMTPTELLELLTRLSTEAAAARAVREVRVRQLLEDDPEGAQFVRDLLQIVERPSDEPWPQGHSFVSAALADGGVEKASRLRDFRDRVPDELGHLLEDLEREGEIPVA